MEATITIKALFHERDELREVDYIVAGSQAFLSIIIVNCPHPPANYYMKTTFRVDTHLESNTAEIIGPNGEVLGLLRLLRDERGETHIYKFRAKQIEWREL